MRRVLLLLALPMMVMAADWPTYKADAARSGIISEELNLPLTEEWVHRSPHRPRPAWRAPAREDLYRGKGQRLHNRQTFDHAYHAISVGDSIFYGSSADDQIYCLDAKTGRPLWRTPREDMLAGYATPVFCTVKNQTDLVVAGSGKLKVIEDAPGSYVKVRLSE